MSYFLRCNQFTGTLLLSDIYTFELDVLQLHSKCESVWYEQRMQNVRADNRAVVWRYSWRRCHCSEDVQVASRYTPGRPAGPAQYVSGRSGAGRLPDPAYWHWWRSEPPDLIILTTRRRRRCTVACQGRLVGSGRVRGWHVRRTSKCQTFWCLYDSFRQPRWLTMLQSAHMSSDFTRLGY